MAQPAARAGDLHVCPMVTGTVPHVGGPILPPGCPTVLIGGQPAARATDLCTCVGPPDVIVKGSAMVLIGGLLAARIGDSTAHGGTITIGMVNVLVGDAGLSAAGVGTGGPPGGNYVGIVGNLPMYKMPDGTIQIGKAITIKGDAAFQSKVISDLQKINRTSTGGKLIQSIDGSGRKMNIEPGTGGNATGYTNPADRFTKPDGTAGSGTDSVIAYDPDTQTIGPEAWGTRPPAIGLAHEMVHGDQAMHGTMTQGTTNNDSKPDPTDPTKIAQEKTREVEAAGIPPNDNRDFNENKIRSEWDPPQPQRGWY